MIRQLTYTAIVAFGCITSTLTNAAPNGALGTNRIQAQLMRANPPGKARPFGETMLDIKDWLPDQNGWGQAIATYNKQSSLLRCTDDMPRYTRERDIYLDIQGNPPEEKRFPASVKDMMPSLKGVDFGEGTFKCLVIPYSKSRVRLRAYANTFEGMNKVKPMYDIAMQLLTGAMYLNSIGLVHGNLNLDTIYVTPSFMGPQVWFTGFDQARPLAARQLPPGTFGFQPPESLTQYRSVNLDEYDLYSIGSAIYQATTNLLPYSNMPATDYESAQQRLQYKNELLKRYNKESPSIQQLEKVVGILQSDKLQHNTLPPDMRNKYNAELQQLIASATHPTIPFGFSSQGTSGKLFKLLNDLVAINPKVRHAARQYVKLSKPTSPNPLWGIVDDVRTIRGIIAMRN